MATNDNRIALISISKLAKLRQDIDLGDMSINEILIQEFYTDNENYEFNTFQQWKDKGMSIIKGSKAFLVWGRKRKFNEKEEEQEQQTDEENNYKFFPVCYLFSNKQVLPQKAEKPL